MRHQAARQIIQKNYSGAGMPAAGRLRRGAADHVEEPEYERPRRKNGALR